MGPILFLIYINDLPNVTQNTDTKYRKLLHFEINILNILNIFTKIIGMAPQFALVLAEKRCSRWHLSAILD